MDEAKAVREIYQNIISLLCIAFYHERLPRRYYGDNILVKNGDGIDDRK